MGTAILEKPCFLKRRNGEESYTSLQIEAQRKSLRLDRGVSSCGIIFFLAFSQWEKPLTFYRYLHYLKWPLFFWNENIFDEAEILQREN